jgi:NAD(P)-dependent dehydrogenase (short-subunit alcohol dehydrogenase family)
MQTANSIYSSTKGALNSFTRALALELAEKRIRVNAILPGMIETNFLLQHGMIDKDNLEMHKLNYPLGRFGTPDDVAHLVVYLLSEASAWMTGSLLTLDGGFSIK